MGKIRVCAGGLFPGRTRADLYCVFPGGVYVEVWVAGVHMYIYSFGEKASAGYGVHVWIRCTPPALSLVVSEVEVRRGGAFGGRWACVPAVHVGQELLPVVLGG